MEKIWQIITFVCLQALLPVSVCAASYTGTVSISEKGKNSPQSEYSDTVVYFIPDSPESYENQQAVDIQMIMEKKAFSPRVLPIQKGTTVSFPNFDPILHNAFSTSKKNSFDLGLYGGGEVKSHSFEKSGLVRVYCNVHHNMVAYILIFDSPFFTRLSSDGSFALDNLPDNFSGKLFIWHPRAKVIKKSIVAAEGSHAESFALKITKRKIPVHKNKLGKSYQRLKDKKY